MRKVVVVVEAAAINVTSRPITARLEVEDWRR